jgi:hypothetical protein
MRIGTCGDPVHRVSFHVVFAPHSSWQAVVLSTGTVVFSYEDASDTRPVSAYGGGFLWIYDVWTRKGAQLAQVSASTGRIVRVIEMPPVFRPLMAADDDGAWLVPAANGEIAHGLAPVLHVPLEGAPSIVHLEGRAALWLTAHAHTVWTEIVTGASTRSLALALRRSGREGLEAPHAEGPARLGRRLGRGQALDRRGESGLPHRPRRGHRPANGRAEDRRARPGARLVRLARVRSSGPRVRRRRALLPRRAEAVPHQSVMGQTAMSPRSSTSASLSCRMRSLPSRLVHSSSIAAMISRAARTWCQPRSVRQMRGCAPVGRIGAPLEVAELLEVVDEVAHRLLCDLGALGEVGQARTVCLHVLEDRVVSGALLIDAAGRDRVLHDSTAQPAAIAHDLRLLLDNHG